MIVLGITIFFLKEKFNKNIYYFKTLYETK